MVILALKNLIQERTKLLISVGGVAAALLLVLVLEGVFTGLEEQMTLYIDKSRANIWVMQKGVSNMHMANTVIPRDLEKRITEVAGVKDVSAILYMPGVVKVKERKYVSYIVGFDPDEAAGGPWLMESGSKDVEDNEVVVDFILAKKNNLEIGDKVEVLGQKLKIIGFSKETFSMNNTLTFLSRKKMEEIMRTPGMASYILVSTDANSKSSTLAKKIKREIEGVNAITKTRLAANDQRMTRQMGIDIINAMSFVGFVIGVIVVGLTIYTVTVDKTRDYGILKAIGAGRRRLYEIVFLQAFFSVLLGLAVGFAASLLVGRLTAAFFPELPVVIKEQTVLKALAAMVIIAFIASYIPIRKIAKIDPLLVFKG